MTKEFALDIFDLLKALDKKDYSYWDKLIDEQRKAYSPLVTMRWTSGTSDHKQIIYVNEFVNRYVFNLGKHQGLLYNLQCVASSGTNKRYSWLPTKNNTKKIKGIDVVMEYHEFGVREAKSVMHLLDPNDIIGMAEELGFDKEAMAKLKRELK